MNRSQRRATRKHDTDGVRSGNPPGTALFTAEWDRPGRDRRIPGCQGPSTPEIIGRAVDVADTELARRAGKERS